MKVVSWSECALGLRGIINAAGDHDGRAHVYAYYVQLNERG
jgi:hypothetical protein